MGIFDIFKKSSKEKTIVANLLDPNRGYIKEVWTIGVQVSQDKVDRLADSGNLYVVIAYVEGNPKTIICEKSIWEVQKADFDRIDEQLNDSPALRMLAEFRKNQKS